MQCNFIKQWWTILRRPHVVIKTRLQTLQKGEGEDTYKGIIDCTRYVFELIICCFIMSKNEGFS